MNAIRRPPARSATFPAPTGGWNANSALDAMPKDQARTLINFFPETTVVRMRRGSSPFCDTGSSAIQTLMPYAGETTNHLLAVAEDNNVYEISTGTAALLGTTAASSFLSFVNFSTTANNYLVAVEGEAIDIHLYNGTVWALAAVTYLGVPITFFPGCVEAYNSRLFFSDADSLNIYYLPVGVVGGALTQFPLGTLCVRGGVISSITTWTRDNAAAGANEMFTITTSKGEVLIYTGPDPATWTLSAHFIVGEPVGGRQAVTKLGPDCILMCQDGFQPMAAYLQLGQSKAQAIALSRNIGDAVTAAVNLYKDEAGWQGTLYPAGSAIIFNIPQGNGVFVQYVINTVTGAWCQYTGINAWCWAIFNGRAYFGDDAGVVHLFDTGTSDNGVAINAEWRGAYQYVGGAGAMKRFTMARPIFRTTGIVVPSFGIDIDFVDNPISAAALSTAGGSVWGSAVWGTGVWGGSYTLQQPWLTVGGLGYAVAPAMKVSSTTISMDLMATNLLFEPGGFV